MSYLPSQPHEKRWSPYLGSEWEMEKKPLVPPARAEAHRGLDEKDGREPAAQPRRKRAGGRAAG